MKKVKIMYTPFNETIKSFEGDVLYTGIDRVYGGWMLTTEGEPFTLENLEDMEGDARTEKEVQYASRLRAEIESLVSRADEALDESDEAYITDNLETWGLE